ncbi:MAG: nucleotidyltransferase [Verrucomicrobia bacterium]|nr:nucleotidyltransferase [Verrucomicrobiota bacterium]
MARTISIIQNEMIAAVQADAVLSTMLTSRSKTAIWRLFLYIVAAAIWTLEKLHDTFKSDVDETISRLKPHSLRWYAEKAKNFQNGYNLVPEADYYDNTGIDPDLIEASKIIAYAAVVEQTRGVRIKVAKNLGTDLGPTAQTELFSFTAYMKEIKDAGVKVRITTGPADDLKMSLRVIYNPLVLNAAGERIDGTSATPVPDAIREHLKNLPFNGVFSIQKLVDAIQAVEGVSDLNVDSITSRYGALPYTAINVSLVPDAGYLRITDENLTITYLPA